MTRALKKAGCLGYRCFIEEDDNNSEEAASLFDKAGHDL